MNAEEMDRTNAVERAEPELVESDRTMPLGVGNFEDQMGQDPLASGAQTRKRADMGTLLIILVVVISLGGLFAMRALARIAVSPTGDPKVEGTIEKFFEMVSQASASGGTSNPGQLSLADGQTVISVLSEEYTDRQVPLSEVQRNPFILFDEPDVTGPIDVGQGQDQEAQWKKQRAEMQAKIESAGERLTLRSVLMASTPLANLNNKIVRVGESILVEPEEISFEVTEITDDAVKLISTNAALDLSVEVTIAVNRQ